MSGPTEDRAGPARRAGAFTLGHGRPAALWRDAAALCRGAFAGKLGPVPRPRTKRRRSIARARVPDRAIGASDAWGRLSGRPGMQVAGGPFADAVMPGLAAVHAWPGRLPRAPFLAPLDRHAQRDGPLTNGICEAARAQGGGVGAALRHALVPGARRMGLRSMRLHATDMYPRTRAPIARHIRVLSGPRDPSPARCGFGCRRATAMQCAVPPRPEGPSHG